MISVDWLTLQTDVALVCGEHCGQMQFSIVILNA